jgi:hypothetical protein
MLIIISPIIFYSSIAPPNPPARQHIITSSVLKVWSLFSDPVPVRLNSMGVTADYKCVNVKGEGIYEWKRSRTISVRGRGGP